MGTPSLGLQPQSYAAAKQGELSGGRGKKYKPVYLFRSLSSVESMQHPSAGPVRNGLCTNHISSGVPVANEPAEATASCDPLIGRKVLMRWPEDNNFYEAVIADYNPFQGQHAIVYEMNTAHETWEYVNLKEVERILSASNPDPLEIDKAKKMLREHEEVLVDAITKLADASDGENGDDQILSHNESMDGG